ncbi:calcium:proton antiporter [Microbacterium sp. gxy059]|uniref:calcium:proton antiporter n=1 Tax=Microbacterium sp. gxy059 TaxID=2957199 RepID=UPI003D99563C
MSSVLRAVLSPRAIAAAGLGWGSVIALAVVGPQRPDLLAGPAIAGLLAIVVAVVVVCAFGVVAQAERLARLLGDPYGTLVLTLSIVAIEVVLISAVMLGPGEHETIARDSVMAVAMIILNLVVGAALVAGGLRHDVLAARSEGATAYLSVLVVLLVAAFALPGLIGSGGAFRPAQAVPILVLTILLYAFFLARQTGAQRADFQEIGSEEEHGRAPLGEVWRAHRAEILARAATLVVTVLPVVLLSHDMAVLLDEGLARAGAPVALSGILIAAVVFLPETITTIRAALAGEMQRVSNLCHGALVSTVGLTIPAVLAIGLATGQTVVLAETPTNLVLLAATLLLSATTFASRRVTAVHGAAHLMLFALYGLSVFA